ncbi:MAG: hypothetical protein IKF09_03235 [Clostridiales bacterium]|nr:hypothetical protein [Clostridiales bacterium]
MIDDPQTLEEKMQNIKELVHQFLPDLPVEWSNSRYTLGVCCNKHDEEGNEYPDLIRISRPMAKVNSWDAIRIIVLHEIAHALTPGHRHDGVWRNKCIEIGGSPDVYATDVNNPRPGYNTQVIFPPPPEKSSKKRKTATGKTPSAGRDIPSAKRYLRVCSKCGKMSGYASRKTSYIPYQCVCFGMIEFIPNPLFGIENYDVKRIFTELKEKAFPIISSNGNTLGIARPNDNSDYFYILCRKVPSKEERDEMYKKLQGLYEYYMMSCDTYEGPGVLDKIIVNYRYKELFIIYVTRAEMWKYFEKVFAQETGPDTQSYTPRDLSSVSYAEVLTETDDCWKKLKQNADSCPNYVFRKWCKHELEQTVEYAEHYGYSYEYDCFPQMPAFSHLLTALFYLNRKYDPRTIEFKVVEDFDVFEKKPADFGERFINTCSLQAVRGNGVRIEHELKKLVKEIRELMEV